LPKRSVLVDAEAIRNPEISDELLENFFDEFGKVTARGATLFYKRSNSRSVMEKLLVREIALVVWRGEAGKSISKFARILGLERPKAEQTIKEALAPIEALPESRQMAADHERQLEYIRYESHNKLVKTLLDAQQKALCRAMEMIPEMSGGEAVRTHDVFLKNAELLSGRVTSRASRTDERSKSTDQLKSEVEEKQKKMNRMGLKLVGDV
jgi:hypothetical protein